MEEQADELDDGNRRYIVSNKYHYKTDSYYKVISGEQTTKMDIIPTSKDILDAYIVPICMLKSKKNGIETPEYGISDSYCPVPSIIYGINYYADAKNFRLVLKEEEKKEKIKSITHGNKYPFCYQKVQEDWVMEKHLLVLGKNKTKNKSKEDLFRRYYEVFKIPKMNVTILRTSEDKWLLSSIHEADEKEETGEVEDI